MAATIDDLALAGTVGEVLGRWPVAGLAVAVVRQGSHPWLCVHGFADVERHVPVEEDTVFRIGSITKTMTAIAVMQLVDDGVVALDEPVDRYLGTFGLVPAHGRFRPVTLRHLLTHTAGVRAVRSAGDLLRPTLAWGVRVDRPVPPLVEYYGGGLHVDAEPGSRFAYSNHGFAVLGQVVEDVSGVPFHRYLRERVFAALGMEHTDVVRSSRVRSRLATGYEIRARGLEPVVDREVVTTGAGSVYASLRDMTRYVTALLDGGTGVLRPGTLAVMLEPHHRPDPRLPGMGLAFFRDDVHGHRIVAHDGIWTGFLSSMVLAPDDGVGVVAMTNTGRFRPGGAADHAADLLLRRLLGVPDRDVVRTDVPQQPARWPDLCGWYTLGPGVLVDPQPRMLFGAGVRVTAGLHHLAARVPVVPWPVPLHPDDPDDAEVFRADLGRIGAGLPRVAFARDGAGRVEALNLHIGRQPMTLRRRRGPAFTATRRDATATPSGPR